MLRSDSSLRSVIPALVLAAAACSHAPPNTAVDSVRLYHPRHYGSESQFNPLSALLNQGYDQYRTGGSRDPFTWPYRVGFSNVWHNVVDPEPAIRHFGWRNWLRDEVFPLTTSRGGGGQWVPNYELHLLGGGATFARLQDWYEDHGVPHPEAFAIVNTMAFHFLNEITEQGGTVGDNEDALTDILIFDTGSILLWRTDAVRRFAVERLHLELVDWNGQPSVTDPGHTLENVYETTMLRAPLPGTANLRAFTTFGASFLAGPSIRMPQDDWISLGGGLDPADNPVIDPTTGKKTVTLLPNWGVFWDRKGSLLLSLVDKGGGHDGVTLNVYPGVLGAGRLSPGLWIQHIHGGGYRAGVTTTLGVGVAHAHHP